MLVKIIIQAILNKGYILGTLYSPLHFQVKTIQILIPYIL